MEDEIWRPVAGFEGFYEVSDLGRVRSLDRVLPFRGSLRRHPGKILTTTILDTGQCVVHLCKCGERNRKNVSHLVAAAFVPGRPRKCGSEVVLHKDGDPCNNAASNLEWRPWGKRRPVVAFKDGKAFKWYESGFAAGIDVGRPQNRISHCCTGKKKSSAGFQWRFADELAPAVVEEVKRRQMEEK